MESIERCRIYSEQRKCRNDLVFFLRASESDFPCPRERRRMERRLPAAGGRPAVGGRGTLCFGSG